MSHITIITYHIKRKLALQCENWKQQQKLISVSLFKQQGNGDFEVISCLFFGRYGRLYTLPTYNFVKIIMI